MTQRDEFKELKFPVPWGHVTAVSWGSTKGKKVLAVHGSMDNARSFDRLINLLPTYYHFVCIDLPGHGFSSHFPSGVPLNFFNYIYTIYLVLHALQWESCIYMGHSMGGQIGIIFNLIYPGKLLKIINIDGYIPLPIETSKFSSHFRKMYDSIALTNNNKSLLYTEEEVLYALQYKRSSTLNTDAAKALFKRAVTKVGNAYRYNRDLRLKDTYRPFINFDQYLVLLQQNLNIPILMIIPSSSILKLNNEILAIIVKNLQNPNLYSAVYVKGNHDVHNNDPEKVAPYIQQYLMDDVKSKL